jgi:hypothetical protein
MGQLSLWCLFSGKVHACMLERCVLIAHVHPQTDLRMLFDVCVCLPPALTHLPAIFCHMVAHSLQLVCC